MRLLVPVILGALLFPGCGEGGETPDPAPSGDEPLVEYSRGGGFAPVYEALVVEADGDVVIRTGGFRPVDQEVTEIRLEKAELAELEALVDDADLEEFAPGNAICADCYEYEVTAGGTTVSLADVDLDEEYAGSNVPEGLEDLIGELGSIVAENAPSEGPSIGA